MFFSPDQIKFPAFNPVVFEHFAEAIIKVRLMLAVTDNPLGLGGDPLMNATLINNILETVRTENPSLPNCDEKQLIIQVGIDNNWTLILLQ